MGKICLRCGKEFTNLKSHLNKKKICSAKYLDINKDQMLEDYNNYLILFKKNMKTSKCELCGKILIKKNLKRHINLIHPTNIDEIDSTQTINYTIVQGDQNNITNNINLPITINMNNFGNELNININDIYDIIVEYIDMLKSSNPSNDSEYNNIANEAIKNFIENLHFTNKENMNIYIPSNHGKDGHIYTNNKWERRAKKDIVKMVICNAVNKLDQGIEDLKNLSLLLENEKSIHNIDNKKLRSFHALVVKELQRKIKESEKDDYDNKEELKEQILKRKAYKKTCDEVERKLMDKSEIAKKHYNETNKNIYL
jgi:DNA-directed RNA polymerase subunit RPC12/RpoP